MSRWFRRFVEEQRVGVAGEHLGQQHTQLEAARQGRQGVVVQVGGQPQTFEDDRRPGLGGVAVVALDLVFQLGESVDVEVVLGVGQELLLFDHDLPQGLVAHESHVEDGVLLEEELVLEQDAEAQALGDRNPATRGFYGTGEDAEEGRLAGAIGADQTVALAGVELKGDIGEQDAGRRRTFRGW